MVVPAFAGRGRRAQCATTALIPPNNTRNEIEGEVMKTIYTRFLSAFLGLAAFGAATRAQEADQLRVKLPHDFVVAGKTLPAGTYKVLRLRDNNKAITITSCENGDSVLLLSTEVTPAREDNPTLTLEHTGKQYFLSQIDTRERVFRISVPKGASKFSVKIQATPSTATVSGGN
jgi:hypothetical protein